MKTILFVLICSLSVLGCANKTAYILEGQRTKSPPFAFRVENPPFCPTCGSAGHVVPIVYGEPSPQLVAMAERGEVTLGGCFVTGKDPRWFCKSDKTRWGT